MLEYGNNEPKTICHRDHENGLKVTRADFERHFFYQHAASSRDIFALCLWQFLVQRIWVLSHLLGRSLERPQRDMTICPNKDVVSFKNHYLRGVKSRINKLEEGRKTTKNPVA